jgi:uncharacterized protein
LPRYSVSPAAAGSTEPIVFGTGVGRSTDELFVGRLNEQGPLRKVFMNVSGESVMAIFGKRGSGKSYTLGVILEGLAQPSGQTSIGKASATKAVLLLDTLNIFWSLENPFTTQTDSERFNSELQRLSSWSIEPPELNVKVWIPNGYRSTHTPAGYADFAIAPSDLTADDIADLLELDVQRDLMGQLIAEARSKAEELAPEFTFAHLLKVLESDSELLEYYAVNTIRGARQRIRAVARLPIFSASKSTRLGDLLKPGLVSVLELGDVPNSLRTVVASVLLRRIHVERAHASDAEKQLALNTRLTDAERSKTEAFLKKTIPPAWVLVDEAQNILPANREVKSSDAVVQFVREGRNFGLSFVLTTQQPSAVDQRILAQADTVICHRLTVAQDIARMRDNLKSAEPLEVKLGGARLDLASWLRSLEPGFAIVTNTDYERVFALEVRPRVTPHGGTGFAASR